MCTGLELALAASAAASGVGGLISANQADKQQAAMVNAQSQELMNFLNRNQQRADEASSVFAERMDRATPESVQAGQEDAAASRTANIESAVDAAPAAAAPIAGSTATVIGDVYRKANERETAKRKSQTDAKAKVGSFGDQWFNQGLMTNDAAQRIGMIGDFGRTDAGLLGSAQDLAGAQAGLLNQPGMFGSILKAAGNAGSMYAGSKAGR